MFTHAIDRLARKDIYLAIVFWYKNKQLFYISNQFADKL